MDFNDFQNLPREEQFKAAASIAGTEPSVFDGIWRTESGRGANMLSPKGAKGHFGLMDPTRETWEKRLGIKVDPMQFGPSLFVAAHTLKENLGRFKKLPDALRAYNGGWTPSTWGNAETAAYAAKVLGTDDESDAVDVLPEAPASGMARTSATALWDTPFSAAKKPVAPGKANPVAAAVTAVAGAITGPVKPATDKVFGMASEDAAAATVKLEKEKEEATFLEMARAAAFREPVNATLRYILRDDEPVDANFQVDEALLKGRTANEQTDLRAATSMQQFRRIMNDQDQGREADSLAFKNGTAWGIGATLIAELPAAAITGAAATVAFSAARVGSVGLALEGRYAAALASSTAEGVVGNIATTALLDSIGERQGATAYAMGVAGGLLNPILMGRSLGRASDRALERATSARLLAEAVNAEERLMAKAMDRVGPNATPEEVREAMTAIEAEGVRADIASHREAIPESRKMLAGEVEQAEEVMAPAAKSVSVIDQAIDELRVKMDDGIAARWEDPTLGDRRIAAALTREDWNLKVQQMTDGEFAPQEVLALPKGLTVTDSAAEAVALRPHIKAITELMSEYLPPDTRIVIGTGVGKGEDGSIMSLGNTHIIAISPTNMPSRTMHSVLHELGHAIYHQHAPLVPPEMMERINAEWFDFVQRAQSGDTKAWKDRFAVTSGYTDAKDLKTNSYNLSRDEYMAEQFVKHLQNRLMAGNHGKLSPTVINTIVNAVRELIKYIGSLVAKGYVKPGKAADEFFSSVMTSGAAKRTASEAKMPAELRVPSLEEMTSASKAMPDDLTKQVNAFITDPVALKHGLDRMPLSTPAERAEAIQVLNLYKKAESPEYVIDEKRLSWLLSKFDSLSPTSNIMLRSKNPVVRMVALELLENGGGAGGRRSTAAIAKHMNERAIVGNTIVDLDRSFNTWFKTQPGVRNLDEALTGTKRSQFNRLVAEEIEQRRYPGQQSDFGQAVRDAADAVEGSFERARLMQVDAKTNGWGALPESSRGYMPHSIQSATYRSLSPSQKRALHGQLTDQFIMSSGWDPTFADQLASKYLDRVEHRALGGFDAPMGLHQTGAADIVREALEQMDMTRPEIDAAMKRYTAGGAGYTKKRLNLDLRKEIETDDGKSFRLIDLFDTDMLSLIRRQSQRVSGEVALARHGVQGKPGLAILRRAMGYGGVGEQADRVAIDAFDQVAAEFLGSPFGVANKNVDRAIQANSVMSLGGMGFNQLGEQINVGMTLGVKAALQNIGSFSRLRSEILALAKGQKVDNELLNSIEQFGGAEFGTDAYKMVFPLDNPDLFANSLGNDTLHAGDRILRGAGHLQSKLSLWRTIHSTQVRGVAEQIVMKASRALHEGKVDYHLRDMGIDDDVVARLKKDLPNIAKYQDGKLVAFDITKATDKEAASAFVQGVHRGASQIIQGTFIGETGKYVHNSWLRMLTQFRTFSLTAIDKQFNRQLGNRGPVGAVMMTLGSMSVAAPIYIARVQLASIGRADRDEYLEKQLAYGAIARATTNYIATAGLGGDFLDAFTSVTGTGAMTGGRSGTNTQLIGNMIAPVAGKVDKVWGALQDTKDGTDVHGLLKEMPLSRLPWFIPAINSLD